MKTTIKTIACGIAALALFACGNDNSASPETTGTANNQVGNDKGLQRISLGSSEEDAYIETILKGHPISNMIMVDPPLCVNDTDGVEWCPPYRVQLQSGTLLHAWDGISEAIYCETASDTISLFWNTSNFQISFVVLHLMILLFLYLYFLLRSRHMEFLPI